MVYLSLLITWKTSFLMTFHFICSWLATRVVYPLRIAVNFDTVIIIILIAITVSDILSSLRFFLGIVLNSIFIIIIIISFWLCVYGIFTEIYSFNLAFDLNSYLLNLVGQFIDQRPLLNQCCHIISMLLKIYQDCPSDDITSVLGEQFQVIYEIMLAALSSSFWNYFLHFCSHIFASSYAVLGI